MAALTRVYTALAVFILASWTIIVLGFTALDVLNTNRSLIELIASPSLLTFLICRLLVVSQSNGTQDETTIAHSLTTAHLRSPRNALILLLLTLSWLYEILFKCVMMLFVTFFGGILATAIYSEGLTETGTTAPADDGPDTKALVQAGEFKENTGVDLVEIVRMIPAKALIYVVVLVWVSIATLGLYVLRLAWRSLRVVFGSSSVAAAVSADMVEVKQ
ncbi:hypothetical protein BDW59DRAFT_153195 [Aspergillus cavernicola]|uniref:Uncharacterized protein n=1 Tax=Aspergillus cavernicola TaxID=176166 RepID=A0ABR4HM91_9EURO